MVWNGRTMPSTVRSAHDIAPRARSLRELSHARWPTINEMVARNRRVVFEQQSDAFVPINATANLFFTPAIWEGDQFGPNSFRPYPECLLGGTLPLPHIKGGPPGRSPRARRLLIPTCRISKWCVRTHTHIHTHTHTRTRARKRCRPRPVQCQAGAHARWFVDPRPRVPVGRPLQLLAPTGQPNGRVLPEHSELGPGLRRGNQQCARRPLTGQHTDTGPGRS